MIDHDRVVAVQFEGHQIGVGHLPGAAAVAGLKVDRPAAALLGRNENIAAVLLQDPERGPMHLRNTASATQPVKKATRARFRPMAGRNFGNFGPCLTGGGKSETIRPNRPGTMRSSPIRLAKIEKARMLQKAHGAQQPAHAVGIRKQAEKDDFAEPVGKIT